MFTMILNILPDYLCRHFISYCANKIAVLPKFTAPKMLLHLRMLSKNYTGTHTLQYPNNLGNTVTRWKRQKYMNMIFSHFQCINLKIMTNRNLLKDTPYSLLDVTPQNPLPILRSPYQMIFRIIYRMTCTSKSHAVHITYSCLPSAGKLFIPV